MKPPTIRLQVLLLSAAVVVASNLQAVEPPPVQYYVDRSFFGVSLTGTVQIPEGDYIIQNMGASPFTSVDLTLTVNGKAYAVNNVLTDIIIGSGRFSISATPTALIFDPSGDGSNPADLVFSDNACDSSVNNRYVIGSNGNPAFEAAYTDTGSAVGPPPGFPVTFAVIPEPATLSLFVLGSLTLVLKRKR